MTPLSINPLTGRDEADAIDAAKQQLAQAQAAAAQVNQELAKLKASSSQQFIVPGMQVSASQLALANATKRAQDADALVKQLQQKLDDLLKARQLGDTQRQVETESQTAAAGVQAQFITEHTLTKEETLSHLSLKYYGSATKPYWMVIYEANKDLIGDNPNRVHAGMVIKIPVLPPNLKKK